MVEVGSTTSTQRLCSLVSAPPWPNFPAEDKSHNLCVDIVDPILIRVMHLNTKKIQMSGIQIQEFDPRVLAVSMGSWEPI